MAFAVGRQFEYAQHVIQINRCYLLIVAIGVASTVGCPRGVAADFQSQTGLHVACSEMASQADIHVCLAAKAHASTAELQREEEQLRTALSNWDEDAAYIKRARAQLDAAGKEFERFRKSKCQFNASLAGGAAGNARENMRLACEAELNLQRAAQMRRAVAGIAVK